MGKHSLRKSLEINEVLTLEEVRSRFQSEWVLLGDPESTDSLEIKGGKVLWHSKDRDEVYRAAVALKPKRFAILYTGQIPKDTAIVL